MGRLDEEDKKEEIELIAEHGKKNRDREEK
jgi:hypothetical protein